MMLGIPLSDSLSSALKILQLVLLLSSLTAFSLMPPTEIRGSLILPLSRAVILNFNSSLSTLASVSVASAICPEWGQAAFPYFPCAYVNATFPMSSLRLGKSLNMLTWMLPMLRSQSTYSDAIPSSFSFAEPLLTQLCMAMHVPDSSTATAAMNTHRARTTLPMTLFTPPMMTVLRLSGNRRIQR